MRGEGHLYLPTPWAPSHYVAYHTCIAVVLATAGQARDDVPRDLHGALETEGL
jgi:hypothetical protein